ncbi:MAG: TetR/AcrR family transcriptional regulator [Deltaproteobacteria bacterium]|nr:TetR/AcrR family transcriptional regulator [Candidatus Zymogenaceae bacterium]
MKKEKLEAILTTARTAFARYGLRKTNLDEIARMARVAKGTIYNYFRSKEGVYLQVLSREVEEIVEEITLSVNREVSPEKKLASFVHSKFQHMRRAVNILNLDREGIEEHLHKADTIRNDLFESEVSIVVSILKEGMEKGVFKLNDILLTARAICHSLRGFELNWLVGGSQERIEHYLDELQRILFFGILSERNC